MIQELVFSNARVVTRDEVFSGTVQVRDGMIADVSRGTSGLAGTIDCEGDHLVPGLVELHTDNLEKHITPRPKVRWHAAAAAMAHDAQMASAGITTVFDAISCGDTLEGSVRLANLEAMIEAISTGQAKGHFRAEHRLHLRCEVSCANILDLFGAFVDNPLVSVVSLMDHTPGQRQFVREDKYREYYMGKYGFTETELAAYTARQQEASALYSAKHRQIIAEICRARGFIVASHDDATLEHVEEARALHTHFSEFPTTLEAARAAKDEGMKILMGAPNVVRGGSHSGNVSATDLAAQGCLDILSSDYVPISLMHAAFLLHRGPLGIALPEAIATVSASPAEVAGLEDRGRIEPGRHADLVRVHDTGDVPVIRAVWRQGRQIA
jgi:alpha-D-ribose 1-methylphosphonate 5-triphosphate diphosphatase